MPFSLDTGPTHGSHLSLLGSSLRESANRGKLRGDNTQDSFVPICFNRRWRNSIWSFEFSDLPDFRSFSTTFSSPWGYSLIWSKPRGESSALINWRANYADRFRSSAMLSVHLDLSEIFCWITSNGGLMFSSSSVSVVWLVAKSSHWNLQLHSNLLILTLMPLDFFGLRIRCSESGWKSIGVYFEGSENFFEIRQWSPISVTVFDPNHK